MAIAKTDKGWRVDFRPAGREGKRIRKTFEKKAEAVRFEAWAKTQCTVNPEWEPASKDKRHLSDLIERWYDLHGKELKDGKNRRGMMRNLCEGLGNPVAGSLTAQHFTEYRAKRLTGGVTANTINHEHAYLRALFNELERLGEWAGGNPVAKVRQIKLDERELSYLTADQVETLLGSLQQSRNGDAYKVALLCLATGARWSEAEKLRAEQIQGSKVVYSGTKSGKSRAVPISPKLAELLKGKQKSGRLFGPCYDAFTGAVERSGLELPKGQRTHILRHTFASHFMQNGGNILTLQRILGHASLAMTMRYAHLSPEHLEEAAKLNPVAGLV